MHVTFTSVARTENRRNLFYWLFEDKKWGWIFYFFGNIFLNLTSSTSTNIWQNIPANYFQKHQSISFLKTFGNFTAKRISIALWKLDSTAGIFLWIHTATYAKTCFCTSSNKIIIFCKMWVFCNFFLLSRLPFTITCWLTWQQAQRGNDIYSSSNIQIFICNFASEMTTSYF